MENVNQYAFEAMTVIQQKLTLWRN